MPEHITETTGTISHASSADPANIAVTLIKVGRSQNGYTYTPAVLSAAAHLFEGVPAYTDHRPAGHSIRDLAGSYSAARFEGDRLRAVLRILDPQTATLVRHIIADREAGIQTPNVGLSVDIHADADHNRNVTAIYKVNSVDVVFNPSAGGDFDRLLEAIRQEEESPMPEPNPIVEATHASPPQPPPAASATSGGSPTPQTITEAAQRLQNTTEQLESLRQARLAACGDILTHRLAVSTLPQPARHNIAEKFVGRIFEASELDTSIAEMQALLGDLMGQTFIHNGGATRFQMGMTKRDRIGYAFDRIFENELPESVRGSVPMPFGVRELFQAAGFNGNFGWEGNRIMESDEVTTSIMANIVGTSINKRLVKDFDNMPKWWKPIVAEVPLRDVKLQTRVLLNDFAVLPTVAERGAYVNLAWDDSSETYTPLKKGSKVVISLETIINDDLRAVQSIPKKLARAATMTINAYVVALFTAQSGTGPALADTYAVFDASNHQTNLGSTALSAATLKVAMLAINKMTDTASHRMGLVGKYLLVPPDLEDTAWTLANTVLAPGTANNDKNYLQGRFIPITVPGFTDANNWYMLADPNEAELIEIGYYNNQQSPELLVQDRQTDGATFTNDDITYKIRWIFGGGWLGYRGAYGAVVT